VNRLGQIVEASRAVMREMGRVIMVYDCMGGPFSQAVELRGFNRLVADILESPASVHALLERTTALSIAHALSLSETGVGINIYESWATLPLISRAMFRDFVVRYERRIVDAVRQRFSTPGPAVIIGGDTSALIDFFIDIGTSLVVADYNTDFSFMRARLDAAGRPMVVRGCLDPKRIEHGDWAGLAEPIRALARKARGLTAYVWGCGCVPLSTPREHVLRFKDLCLAAETGAEEPAS